MLHLKQHSRILYKNWPLRAFTSGLALTLVSMMLTLDTWCGLYRYKSMPAITSVNADARRGLSPALYGNLILFIIFIYKFSIFFHNYQSSVDWKALLPRPKSVSMCSMGGNFFRAEGCGRGRGWYSGSKLSSSCPSGAFLRLRDFFFRLGLFSAGGGMPL